jgi:murein DD-endopeptidase MepM/ murein hydrolase activator NlpD
VASSADEVLSDGFETADTERWSIDTAGAGMHVQRGQPSGMMGNSGRGDTRHLRFELGSPPAPPDPCAAALSVGLAFDSRNLDVNP